MGDLPPVMDISWSPDGRRLALLTESDLLVYEPLSCALETWAQVKGQNPELLGWEPDGSRVVIRLAGGGLQSLGPDGGQDHPSTTSPAPTAGGEPPPPLLRPPFIPAQASYTTSADGERYVYMDETGFWTVNQDGTNRLLLMDQVLPGIQEMIWLAQDEIVLTRVDRSAGGGTIFNVWLITRGEANLLASFVRSTLYPRPDLRQVAFIQGPPVDTLPGALGFYPAPPGCAPASEPGEPGAAQTWAFDLDRDGVEERVVLTRDSLVMARGTGQVVYHDAPLTPAVSLQPYTMPDGHILLHAKWLAACPNAPLHQIFWYDPETGLVTDLYDVGICSDLTYKGDGLFLAGYRATPLVYVTELRWERRQLATGETSLYLSPFFSVDTLPWALADIASLRLRNPEQLFDPPSLYQDFAARTGGDGWNFAPLTPAQPGQLQLEASRNGEPRGRLVLTVAERPDGLRITGLTWLDPPPGHGPEEPGN